MAASAPTGVNESAESPGQADKVAGNQSLNFGNIRLNGSGDLGQFRTLGDKFGWQVRRPLVSGEAANRRPIQFVANAAESAFWMRTNAREWQLKIVLKSGDVVRFDGFKETDLPAMQKHVKQCWGLDLKRTHRLATKGCNWGRGRISGRRFEMRSSADDTQEMFDFPCEAVRQVYATKGDLVLNFVPDESRASVEDQLLEMRLMIPGGREEDEDFAEQLKTQFHAVAGNNLTRSHNLCSISDLKVLVPAGRFDLVVQKVAIKLQGRSSDFNIEYKNIVRMYLLGAAPHTHLVLSLQMPLRKGRTSYPNVIVRFDDKYVVDLEIALTEPEIKELEEKSPAAAGTEIKPVMNGPAYDLTARLLKLLTGRQMIVPGDFRSAAGLSCFRCSYKAESGTFYPLNRSFIFIPKPVIIVRYDDVATVSFGRTSGSQTKLFEFDITLKSGQAYAFSSVDRQESGPFVDFLTARGVRVRSFTPDDAPEKEGKSILDQDLPSEESDDEEFHASTSSSEDGSDDDDEDGNDDGK